MPLPTGPACAGRQAALIARHQLPFSTLDLPDAERQRAYGTGPIELSYSLTTQIGGQLAAGFTLTYLDKASYHADGTARYIPGALTPCLLCS